MERVSPGSSPSVFWLWHVLLFLSPLGFQSCIPLSLLQPTLLIFPSSSSLTKVPWNFSSMYPASPGFSFGLYSHFQCLTWPCLPNCPTRTSKSRATLESLLSQQNQVFPWGFFSLFVVTQIQTSEWPLALPSSLFSLPTSQLLLSKFHRNSADCSFGKVYPIHFIHGPAGTK